MDNLNLMPIWRALLDMYAEFSAFCSAHGLIHYVAYGTLLGAVRHKGFIPWDDDFDVMMPRPDYERLITLRAELPTHLYWSSIETNPEHQLLFGKIVERRSDFIAQVQRESNLRLAQGLFIDVFPIDGLPANNAVMFAWRIGRALRRRFCSQVDLQKWFVSRKYEAHKFVGVANNENGNPNRYRYPKVALGEPKEIPFDDTKVYAPQDAETILTVDFGDWRSLPPVDMRLPSHQVIY